MKFSRKIVALVVLISVVGAIFGSYVEASKTPYKLGAIVVSPEDYSKLTGAKLVPLTKSAYEYLIQIAPLYPREYSISKDTLYTLTQSTSADTLPSAVSNTYYLPPVGNQGGVGSCNAWSSTYYVYTYMINWFRNHPEPRGNYVMNPTFTYNLINDGTDSGSIPEDAMVLISSIGAVPLNDFPLYNASSSALPPDYPYVWPNETHWKEAILNKGSSSMYDASGLWGVFHKGESYGGKIYIVNLSNTTQFDYFKGLLVAGYVAQTTIYVYSNFYNFDATNNVYALGSTNPFYYSYVGAHAVTIIGYDDSLNTPDGSGAFLMVNSWGTNWGDGGYWWLTYPAARGETRTYSLGVSSKTVKLSTGYAYIYVPASRSPHKPDVYSVFHITHSKRGEIIGGYYGSNCPDGYICYPPEIKGGIELGIGNVDSPMWSRRFFDFVIGYQHSLSDLANYQAHPFPDSPIVLDLSDSLSALNFNVNSQYAPVFIHLADKYQDGVTGTLDSFEVVVNSTYLHKIVKSTELPVSIPENGNWLTVSVNVPVVEYAGITPLQGEVLHTNWAYIEVGSLVNVSSVTLTVGGNQYTMRSDSPEHFYYNLTGLDDGVYTYRATVTFQNGNTVTLPLRTFGVNTGDLAVYVSPDSSSWVSTVTVAPGEVTYVDNTFVWKNAAGGGYSPFTSIYYHITDMEAKYDSEEGMLLFKIGVTPLNNLGWVPASLLNISFDTNGDGNWDYHAVVDLSKPGTKPGVVNILDLYNSDGANVANLETVFIPVPSDSAVYLQIPDDVIGVSGQTQIVMRVQLYEHDDVYRPLDVLTTSSGETTATLDLTQVPTFSNVILIGLVLLSGIFFFRRE